MMARIALGLALILIALAPVEPVISQTKPSQLAACSEFAFSTEEDFLTQGPSPPDGNSIISDGDLLSPNGVVCARNEKLLYNFDVTVDLGLDAVDVIDVQSELVAFSTELDSPHGNFKAGDLLATNGAVLPNVALLAGFELHADLGLDAVHFVGTQRQISAFLAYVADKGRDFWVQNPGRLPPTLKEYGIDIWFSTEGTAPTVEQPAFLDGDLLSAREGVIVVANSDLLPPSVPAGIPNRGVDFGLDAAAATRTGKHGSVRYSTEILYRGEPAFSDGDVLKFGDGVLTTNSSLVTPFEPKAHFLGLDALFMALGEGAYSDSYLPLILKRRVGGMIEE
ncbi:MAG TPA: hypothetical protein EYP04_00375 [Anaerolineae bacterium]|nr:hypothetical protein [Anaerolineae bacterium]HIQ04654.1 hypothetical protein [Anaerolineae bacterium]